MKKKFLSLALALVMCLSLAVPALAYIDEGPGWTWDDENVLTLNGVQNESFDVGPLLNTSTMKSYQPTIVLAPGSKNTLTSIFVDAPIDDGKITGLVNITIKGSGELIIYNTDRATYGESSVFLGDYTLKLEDGLVMTGGTKPGDSTPVTVEARSVPEYTWSNGISYRCMAGSTPATYIRIAPGSTSTSASSSTSTSTTSTGFTDVPASSPFAEAIKWAVENGITKGTTATTFSPNAPCTDGQFWTFVWRANGSPTVSNAARGPSEADRALAWAAAQRYISDGTQDHPEYPCVRQEAMNFFYNIAGRPQPSKIISFSDVASDSPFRRAISWAVENGITNGTSATTFSPNATCTRGQIMTFLYRASK